MRARPGSFCSTKQLQLRVKARAVPGSFSHDAPCHARPGGQDEPAFYYCCYAFFPDYAEWCRLTALCLYDSQFSSLCFPKQPAVVCDARVNPPAHEPFFLPSLTHAHHLPISFFAFVARAGCYQKPIGWWPSPKERD